MTSDGELHGSWRSEERVTFEVACCRNAFRFLAISRRVQLSSASRKLIQFLRCNECRIWWSTLSWSSRECKCRALENVSRVRSREVWVGRVELRCRRKLRWVELMVSRWSWAGLLAVRWDKSQSKSIKSSISNSQSHLIWTWILCSFSQCNNIDVAC